MRYSTTALIVLASLFISQQAAAQGMRQRFAENALAVASAESNHNRVQAPKRHEQVSVAVYNLKLENVPTVFGNIVTDSLLTEIRKLQSVNAIGLQEIQEMISLEATKQMSGCDESESCLAEISGALGVDELITGTLSETPSGRVIIIRRINQRRSSIISTFTKRLTIGNGEEFLAVIGQAVGKLYSERDIRPGESRGVAAEVALELNPPPVAAWVTFTTGTLALVAGAAGGVFGYQAMQTGESFANPSGNQSDAAYWMNLQNQGQQLQQSANASFMLAGTLALTTVVMSLFTDWNGYSGGE